MNMKHHTLSAPHYILLKHHQVSVLVYLCNYHYHCFQKFLLRTKFSKNYISCSEIYYKLVFLKEMFKF